MECHKICAIHQPNFFPWLGYFNKIYQADIFILLNDVLKSGHSGWGNRVSIIVSKKTSWMSAPIIHRKEPQKISEICVDYTTKWQQKTERILTYNYKKAPYYEEIMEYLMSFLNLKYERLADLNEAFIRKTCEKLTLNTKILKQSEMGSTENSTRLLIELTQKAGCDTYLCGGGATGYQEDDLFEENGLILQYQHFIHPVYPQFTENFIEGQSILDALFHCGFQGTKNLLACPEG